MARSRFITWKAGDVPFLPEQAQLIADMWEKNLGIDVEVIVGEAATVRERWFDRQLDGKVIIRANETGGTAEASPIAILYRP